MNHEIYCELRYDARLLMYIEHTQYSHKPDGFNHVKYNCCQFPMYPAEYEVSAEADPYLTNVMAVLWDDRELNESIAVRDWKIVRLDENRKFSDAYDDCDAYESERERKLAKWKNEDLDTDALIYDPSFWEVPMYADPDGCYGDGQLEDAQEDVWYEHEQKDWYAQDDWEKDDKEDIWDEQMYWDKQAAECEQEDVNRSSDPAYDLEDQLIESCYRKSRMAVSYKKHEQKGWTFEELRLGRKWRNNKAKYGKNKCKGNYRKTLVKFDNFV